MLFFIISCLSSETESNSNPPSVSSSEHQKPMMKSHSKKQFENMDKGQKHPPLPANNPVWEWDAKAFVPDFGWFGEHSWMDVRMRVAGHISAAGRDKARIFAMKEEWSKAAQAYQQLFRILSDIPTSQQGTSKQINTHLILAAQRDAQLLEALSEDKIPTNQEGTIYPLRLQYYALAQRYTKGDNVEKEANALQLSLQKHLSLRADLEISSFKDFHSRHQLRIRLFEAYLDALDPLSINESWGYWEADEIIKQINAIGSACTMLGGTQWEISPEIAKTKVSPYLWPSFIAENMPEELDSSVEEFGALPTGDSLIDIASSPGPKAIGDLMKWGLNDKEHASWLKKASQEIVTVMQESPEKSIEAYKKHIQYLEKAQHGSRFYNVKQLRNATVRQLARSKSYLMAHKVLQDNFPLHHQDWACPNREGILRAIDGRLLALAKDEQAEHTLASSIKLGQDFLIKVDRAEKGLLTEPKPPRPKMPSNGPRTIQRPQQPRK